MGKCRIPAAIIAVIIGGAGLTACGASGSSSTAAVSAAASSDPPAASPTLTSTPSSSPAASPTSVHSTAARSSSTATASAKSATSTHATSSAHATSSSSSTSSGTHNFTVPAIPGDDIVSGYGSYTKIGTARVKVTMCAKQTAPAFSVGTQALVYNSSGASQNLGAVILTGPGDPTCVTETFLFYTAHLKVHAFIGGSQGTIAKTGPVLTLY
jgi:hypothetical protein